MTDRDLDSLIEQIVRDGKDRLADGDRDLVSQLLREYSAGRERIGRELLALEEQILWSIENSPDITESWVRRQTWYEALDASIQSEIDRLEASTRNLTVQARTTGTTEAIVTSQSTFRAIPGLPRVNAGAVTNWTAAIQPGSPLDKVLDRFGDNAGGALRKEITAGLIDGRGSSNVVRTVIGNLNESMPPYDASRIVRNEMMRSYRGVYQEQMERLPDGAVAGYRWLAALDARTCPVCLGLHGHIFPEYPSFQHVMCRCVATLVLSPRYAPPRTYQTGDQWLALQSQADQMRVLGPARYELWTSGTTMRDMVEFTHDPVWGGSTRLVPVGRLQP